MNSKLELILLYDILRTTPYLTVYTFLTQEPLVRRDTLIVTLVDCHNHHCTTIEGNIRRFLPTDSLYSFFFWYW
jgi:hypothetical protein